jgi:hypothetical protein
VVDSDGTPLAPERLEAVGERVTRAVEARPSEAARA